jgi:ribosomal protein S18 acetylase RimI-like enzyme
VDVGQTAAVPTARHATRSDVDALGQTLAGAFGTDPVWRWLIPDDARWDERAAAFFARETATRLRLGHTYTTDGCTGAALWAPPGFWRETWVDQIRAMRPSLRLFGLSPAARRGFELLRAIEHAHPAGDHWYLAVLGTHPDHQGKGVGASLLAPVLARCDLDGTPAYLESSNPQNVAFYNRFGFEVTGQVTPTDGPTLDLMWRDPRPPEDGSG